MQVKVRITSKQRPKKRPLVRRIERFFWFTGLVALGYCGFIFLQARIYQINGNRQLEESSPSVDRPQAPEQGPGAKPQGASPSPPPPEPGTLIGRLSIPRVGLSAIVLEGDDTRTFQLGIGHLPGTALPGGPGNVVLAAHRDTFFRPLRKIRKMDTMTLTTPHGSHKYLVESIAVVDPDHTQVLESTLQPTLTLVTCYPFSFVGHAPKRFVVQARRVDVAEPPQNSPSSPAAGPPVKTARAARPPKHNNAGGSTGRRSTVAGSTAFRIQKHPIRRAHDAANSPATHPESVLTSAVSKGRPIRSAHETIDRPATPAEGPAAPAESVGTGAVPKERPTQPAHDTIDNRVARGESVVAGAAPPNETRLKQGMRRLNPVRLFGKLAGTIRRSEQPGREPLDTAASQ